MTADEGTTEDVFVVANDLEPGVPINAINCAISRAQAILNLIMPQFDGTSEFRHSDPVICNAIWAIQGEIEKLSKMVHHGYETTGLKA